MKIQRFFLVSFFLFLLVMPSALAVDSLIDINSPYRGYGLIVRVKDPGSMNIIDSLYGKTDADGKAQITYSTSRTSLSFTVLFVDGNGNVETTKTFEDKEVLANILLTVEDENQNKTEANKTIVETETQTEEKIASNNNTALTGNVIKEDGFAWNNNMWYLIAVVGVFVGIVIMMKITSYKMSSRGPSSPPGAARSAPPANIEPSNARMPRVDEELYDIDKKIVETESQLLNLKKNKLSEVQREVDKERSSANNIGKNQDNTNPGSSNNLPR